MCTKTDICLHTGVVYILFHFPLDLIDCKYSDSLPPPNNPLFSVDLTMSVFDLK